MPNVHVKTYSLFLIVILVSALSIMTAFPIMGPPPSDFDLSVSQLISVPNADVCGAITTDTTWDLNGSPWVLTCDITVAADVALTIDPGVVVMGQSAAMLTVEGHLQAEGTPTQPVIFTSNDDTFNGNTWGGIHFKRGTGVLSHTVIRYASHTLFAHNSSITVDNVTSGTVHIKDSQIVENKYTGLYAVNSNVVIDSSIIKENGLSVDFETVYATSSTITVTNTIFQDNFGYGLWTENGTVLTAANNTFSNNGNYPLVIESANLHRALTDHSFSDNTPNRIFVETGSIIANTTLPVSVGLEGYELGTHNSDLLLKVPSGLTLVAEPGVKLIGQSAIGIMVEGHLQVEGTSAQPIIFTSNDDTFDGNTWGGIHFKGGTGVLNHSVIRYASHTLFAHNSSITVDNVTSGTVHIKDSQIVENKYTGLYAVNSNVVIDNSIIKENGLTEDYESVYATGSTITVTDTVFQDNLGYGLWTESGTVLTATNNTFSNNGNYPLVIEPTNLHRALTDHSFSDNTPNRILVSDGELIADTSLPAINGLDGYEFKENLTVPSNITLMVGPGNKLFWRGQRLFVYGNLIAAGIPSSPIYFTSRYDNNLSRWEGISLVDGSARLENTTIRYAGSDGLVVNDSQMDLYQVTLSENLASGLYFTGNLGQTNIEESKFIDNRYGISNDTGTEVDARNSWWGHPFGPYHPTLNSDGLGNEVSDDVLFDPWWQKVDGPSRNDLFTEIIGVSTANPGQHVDYAISYANYMTETLEDAVLIMDLPYDADYVHSSPEGIYWPERHQLFWKLETVPSGTKNVVSFQVRYEWGIPIEQEEQMIAILTGTIAEGSQQTANNMTMASGIPAMMSGVYLSYQPVKVIAREELTLDDVMTERQSFPEIDVLYQEAMNEGYIYGTAHRLTLDNGSVMTQIILMHMEQRTVIFLRHLDEKILAFIIQPTQVVIKNSTGGLTYNLQTHTHILFGDWDSTAVNNLLMVQEFTFGQCFRNCVINLIPGVLLSNFSKKAQAIFTSWDCTKCYLSGKGNSCESCAAGLSRVPGAGETVALITCKEDCERDPNSHACTNDKYQCNTGGFWGLLGRDSVERCPCDPILGRYTTCETRRVCALNEKCIEGADGPQCGECTAPEPEESTTLAASFDDEPTENKLDSCALLDDEDDSACHQDSTKIVRARDPNAKYGVEGDVLPGQLLTYTITIENEGAGIAYGVFVVDKLSDYLDETTLTIYGSGEYLAAAHTLMWNIGELAPKGELGSTDVVSFTIQVKHDAASGLVILNDAVVHFPSVPEETKTNTVVNVVQELTAVPQTLQTESGHPLTITLQGMDIANSSLTYRLVDTPLHGEWEAMLPTLVYTPDINFTGSDYLRFSVSNGITESRPAAVQIEVLPAEDDATPPEVVWTTPGIGDYLPETSITPYLTDAHGPLFAPVILVQFSEAINAATATTNNITLQDDKGQFLATSIIYDEEINQAAILLREPLQMPMTYTVVVKEDIIDLRGNSLTDGYIWHFQTGNPSFNVYLPIVIK
ncbi:MAG: hypothetical protein DWQ04_20330 [Chloroflexi bacterium]|nr:MAG: hypothetical protein DWQ04_20330 [Chloroflexota bacterium]